MLNKSFMIINIIDRVKLPFRKEKELYSSLFNIIGLYPHNISYYKLALMHKSVMHRNKKGKPVNNERLEFLGDAILDAAVGDIVYRHFPGKREGFLTNTRSKLVQRETLNKLAQEMGINKLILSSGHSASHNSYLGGNAFEALVGALYLDRGYDACMVFLKKRILSQMINIDKVAYKEVNFKSKLIEWSQKNKVKLEYKFISSGKDNGGSPTFCYQVVLEGIEGCKGDGFSKKESQQKASKDTLEQLKTKPQFIDQVFAAKGERTKMEEEPMHAIPNIDETQAFMKTSTDDDQDKHKTAFREKVYTEDESAADERHETVLEQPAEENDNQQQADEFDLSDISAKAQSREEIIAAAEKEAFKE
jgi:ribonuclease-3